MFHCSGWTYTWAVTAVGGTHVCLRKVDPALIFPAIARHRVTHMCGAPIVLNMLVHAPAERSVPFAHTVEVATGGAAPPSDRDRGDGADGLSSHAPLRHSPRATGPRRSAPGRTTGTGCRWPSARSLMARQGVRYADARGPDGRRSRRRMVPVPRDGTTMGEVMLRGNTVMKGYLKNPRRDRRGVRRRLVSHRRSRGLASPTATSRSRTAPRTSSSRAARTSRRWRSRKCSTATRQVMEAAVVARPDANWGETPCAFVTLKPGATVTAEDIIASCRDHHGALQGAAHTSCSARCRRPRPARSRNSSCANGPRRPADGWMTRWLASTKLDVSDDRNPR